MRLTGGSLLITEGPHALRPLRPRRVKGVPGRDRLVRGAVPGEHVRRDASPGRNLDALLTCPCPDVRLVVPGRPRTAPGPPGGRHLARRFNVGTNRLRELVRVLL